MKFVHSRAQLLQRRKDYDIETEAAMLRLLSYAALDDRTTILSGSCHGTNPPFVMCCVDGLNILR